MFLATTEFPGEAAALNLGSIYITAILNRKLDLFCLQGLFDNWMWTEACSVRQMVAPQLGTDTTTCLQEAWQNGKLFLMQIEPSTQHALQFFTLLMAHL